MANIDTIMQIVNDPDASAKDVTLRLWNRDSWNVDVRDDDA